MSPTNLKRWSVLAAGASGLAWAISGVVHYALVFPGEGTGPVGSASYYLIEAAYPCSSLACCLSMA